ncbi:MAG: alpha/beta fold hydrolase [Trebonia sp.]
MTTCTIDTDLTVPLTDTGHGRPVLLLHGGAGPDSVAGFGERLAARHPVRVLTPVHPGFGGTARPGRLGSIRELAGVHARLLERLGLTDVTVAGSSIGGWIAAELALAAPSRVSRLALIDAVGLASPEHPVADFFALTPAELAAQSWARPEGHVIDFASMTDAQRAVFAGNRAALAAYGGPSMADPGLRARLGSLAVPTVVVWGEADGIATPEYGREYAAAIPGASFRLLRGAGHLPQLETPEAVLDVLGEFLGFVPQSAR